MAFFSADTHTQTRRCLVQTLYTNSLGMHALRLFLPTFSQEHETISNPLPLNTPSYPYTASHHHTLAFVAHFTGILSKSPLQKMRIYLKPS